MTDRQWHYLTANETTRVPRSLVVIDTESRITRTPWGHEQTWRCGVAWFRKAPKGRKPRESVHAYTTPESMWVAVSEHCGRSGRTVLYAHNLGYDARIAECFTILPSLGWVLTAHNMAPRGTWMVWRRGDASLTMTDTASIWPTTLAAIAKSFGLGVPATPADPDDDKAWLAKCHRDVLVTAHAVTAYLAWIEDANLGNWQYTGAGQSWAAFRHRHLTHRMLIHDDGEALAAERRAMWTGRCEAYWHGTLLRQVADEWDLHAAYARVARDCPVPVRLVGPMPARYPWQSSLANPGVALLATATIVTDVPVVPALVGDRIVWPVGTFETTLWTPELRMAVENGAQVTVHRGWLYHAKPALRSWAQWILDMLAAPDDVCPAWMKMIFKHWSRALIGRFAMTYASWEQLAELALPGVDRRTCVDLDSETTYELMQVGFNLWEQAATVEWAQSMPMVTGYVMSACRARLWNIMAAMPDAAPLYCDTDSIITTDRWRPEMLAIAATPVGEGLRLKRSWDGIQIMGPRQIVTGEKTRLAGLPSGARRTGRSEFQGEVWESLARAFTTGRPGMVRTMDRTWRPKGIDRRRHGHGVGWTTPIQIGERRVIV